MSFWAVIKVSLRALAANKVRTGLTMLGIIIGVAAVVAMVALGSGASQSVSSRIQSLGSNLITVMPGFGGSFGGARQALGTANSLTLEDAVAIKKQLAAVSEVSPEYSSRAQVVFKSNNLNSSINGITTSYEQVRNVKVASGRFITDNDLKLTNRVAVLGQNLVTDLLSGEQAVGKVIKINNIPFIVVGVLEAKGGLGFDSPDDTVFVPLTTAQNRLFGTNSVSRISVQIKEAVAMNQALEDIGWLLLGRHRLKRPEDADFRLMNQQDVLQTMSQVTGIMTLLLGGIASISLIVGGIGIMNIMLVSVTERTREIGLRKAVGAKRRDILKQFLTESVTLSLIGGLIGILLGAGGSKLIALVSGMATAVSLNSILLAFIFSSAVGIFFGIYPALRASQLSPIEALRYE